MSSNSIADPNSATIDPNLPDYMGKAFVGAAVTTLLLHHLRQKATANPDVMKDRRALPGGYQEGQPDKKVASFSDGRSQTERLKDEISGKLHDAAGSVKDAIYGGSSSVAGSIANYLAEKSVRLPATIAGVAGAGFLGYKAIDGIMKSRESSLARRERDKARNIYLRSIGEEPLPDETTGKLASDDGKPVFLPLVDSLCLRAAVELNGRDQACRSTPEDSKVAMDYDAGDVIIGGTVTLALASMLSAHMAALKRGKESRAQLNMGQGGVTRSPITPPSPEEMNLEERKVANETKAGATSFLGNTAHLSPPGFKPPATLKPKPAPVTGTTGSPNTSSPVTGPPIATGMNTPMAMPGTTPGESSLPDFSQPASPAPQAPPVPAGPNTPSNHYKNTGGVDPLDPNSVYPPGAPAPAPAPTPAAPTSGFGTPSWSTGADLAGPPAPAPAAPTSGFGTPSWSTGADLAGPPAPAPAPPPAPMANPMDHQNSAVEQPPPPAPSAPAPGTPAPAAPQGTQPQTQAPTGIDTPPSVPVSGAPLSDRVGWDTQPPAPTTLQPSSTTGAPPDTTDWEAKFKKDTGTRYNRHSQMDRANMEKLKAGAETMNRKQYRTSGRVSSVVSGNKPAAAPAPTPAPAPAPAAPAPAPTDNRPRNMPDGYTEGDPYAEPTPAAAPVPTSPDPVAPAAPAAPAAAPAPPTQPEIQPYDGTAPGSITEANAPVVEPYDGAAPGSSTIPSGLVVDQKDPATPTTAPSGGASQVTKVL